MTIRRKQNSNSRPREDDRMSEAALDQAYGQRGRGAWEVNKTISISVVVALAAWTFSGVWFAAGQSASLTTAQAAIVQLQASEKENRDQITNNEKENEKQRVEILVHLSNMDQSLKDILNYGITPRNIPSQSGGPTIIQQAPAASSIERRTLRPAD